MPYYRCPSCGLTSYSAASGALECATCSATLPKDSKLHLVPGEAPELTRSLAMNTGAPAEARRAVARLPLPQATRDDLTLVVSELVTNSIRHAGPSTSTLGTIGLQVTTVHESVRVAVHDGGRGFAPAARAERGGGVHGLGIVAALSHAWGVACDGDGCTVWSVVAVDGAPGAAADAAACRTVAAVV
jgi:anti-sigma regulatory factor (Ser/Thr protein kinase)